MTETLPPPPGEPRIATRRRLPSAIWIVPLLALLIGLSMLVHAWLSAGPEIVVSFQSATGLEAGKTPVKYKDVVIGLVKRIELNDDQSAVLVTIDLDKNAKNFTRADSRYWVVRPRIGMGGVSGIDTLFSGAYIGVDSGHDAARRDRFTGLETPPTIINGTPGKAFILHAPALGSLDIGSPVYYRNIQVGQLASYLLDADGQGVTLRIFVRAPYHRLVSSATHFWNASGVDLSLNADGLKLQTQSVATMLAGGIAFDTVLGNDTASPPLASYDLASDRQSALAPPDGDPMLLRLKFDQALRGLAVNAPVEFRGIDIGKVQSVHVEVDPVSHRYPVVVDALVYPRRIDHSQPANTDPANKVLTFLHGMVAQGLRAQARSGNLLTGQLYIAFDFFPSAPKADFDPNSRPVSLPTIAGGFDQLQEQMAGIVGKLNKVPFDTIARHLDDNLVALHQTLHQVNGQMLPAARDTLGSARQTLDSANNALAPDAPLQQNLNQTLLELQRSARSLRGLTDQLNAHPEALIRGRQDSGEKQERTP